jgi:hypothetical protein
LPASTAATATSAKKATAKPASRAERAAARAAARAIPPTRRPELAHLDLNELRSYRKTLEREADRVSYWRRILQAKLDTLRAGDVLRDGDLEALRPVLTDERVASGRAAIVAITAANDIPMLPSLAELWDREVDPQDVDAVELLDRELTEAEAELSDYRTALHDRLAAATGELVARYREDPTACLTALPSPDLVPRRLVPQPR